ncbi:MAG: GNAT family N-acetyltransferase, partial [Planctomycetota bacterium]
MPTSSASPPCLDPAPATEGLRVVHADTLEAFAPHATAWDALAASLPQTMPMLSHAWVATWLEGHLSEGGRPLGLFAYAGARLVGVLAGLLLPRRVLGLARERFRVPCAYVTEDGDLALAPDRAVEALGALLAALRRTQPRCLAVDLGGVRDDSPTLEAVRAGVAGWSVAMDVDVTGASIPLDGGFEAWEAGLGKSLRKSFRSGRNRLRREGRELVHVAYRGSDARPEQLEDLAALEAAGWKGREGTAIASREESRTKYGSLARRFAAQGRLEWHHFLIGDELAAARMVIRYDQGLMLLRSAYDERFRRFNPGNLSLHLLMADAFERGVTGEINLVTDWPWCRPWNMRHRPYRWMRLTPRRPVAWLGLALPARARRAGRRIPGLGRLRR